MPSAVSRIWRGFGLSADPLSVDKVPDVVPRRRRRLQYRRAWWVCRTVRSRVVGDHREPRPGGASCKRWQSRSRECRSKPGHSLAERFPELAAEWHPRPNPNLTPSLVSVKPALVAFASRAGISGNRLLTAAPTVWMQADVQRACLENSTVITLRSLTGAHCSTGADTADDNSIPHHHARAYGSCQLVAAPKGSRWYILADGREFAGWAHLCGK